MLNFPYTGGNLQQLLLTLQEELHEKLRKELWPRRISLPTVKNKIHSVISVRRTGKTALRWTQHCH